jgi:pyruvate/2-oxoglutarate dehydrogenase complex dihydrolipoamide dehydrogenase (E3) component
LRRGLVPSRGGGSVSGSSGQAQITEQLGNLTTLVKELQENLDSTKEEFNQSVNKRIEEGNSKIQHKVVTQINDNFEKLEQTKCEEKFKLIKFAKICFSFTYINDLQD